MNLEKHTRQGPISLRGMTMNALSQANAAFETKGAPLRSPISEIFCFSTLGVCEALIDWGLASMSFDGQRGFFLGFERRHHESLGVFSDPRRILPPAAQQDWPLSLS